MSRVKRLKRRRAKNKIKATSYGLALALTIGSVQGLGTYALFTDTEDIDSSIALSTGDIDVEIEGDGFDITHETNEKDDDNCTDHDFSGMSIVNKGTLNQNLKIGISPIQGISDEVAKKIEFDDLEFCYCGKDDNNCSCDIEIEDITLYKLMNNTFNIKNNDGSLFVLKPGQKLDIKGEIEIEGVLTSAEIEQMKEIKLELNVYASQINSTGNMSSYGFYDIASKWNTIRVVQKEVVTIATGEKAYFTGGNGNKFDNIYIPININNSYGKIKIEAEVSSMNNTVKYDAIHYEYKDKDYILIQSQGNINVEFKSPINITIYVTVTNGNVSKTYELQCNTELKNAGNDCDGSDHPNHGVGGKCHGEVVLGGHKKISSIGDITEVPSEPETTEPPKEDVVLPSEPEIVEPPKEEVPVQPEVVEPPKEEIEQPQIQPEIIEPPVENKEIQE